MLHINDQIIKHKLGLLNLAEELGNVFRICQAWGYPATRSIAINNLLRRVA